MSNAAQSETRLLPAESFIDSAAQQILERHSSLLPDLSSLNIVAAARPGHLLRIALAQGAANLGHPALLLPRIGTLAELAARHGKAPAGRICATAERELDIFQALKKMPWLSPGEAWVLSAELVGLADELTDNLVALPATLEAHAANLARAYAIGKRNADFSFEASLSFDVWRTLAQPGDGLLDAPANHALLLASWVAQAASPLIVIGSGHTGRERAFLAAWSGRAPLLQFIEAGPASAQSAAWPQFLAAAFAAAPGGLPAARSVPPQPLALADLLRSHAARDVEDEALAALATLRRWLLQGKRQIAVVALDRQAARRLRALAEREQILMSDEIGWPYSTTLSATAVMRWLEARRDGFYHATLVDLLKSPFIFADLDESWGRPRAKAAVLGIELAIRRVGIVSGLTRVRGALQSLNPMLIEAGRRDDGIALLDRLIAADRAFSSARRSVAEWMDSLGESLAALGMYTGLARDAAGAGLLANFAAAQRDVAASRVKLTMNEWTDWLRTQMESAHFRDQSIDSPIVVTSLEATRYRHFEAVLLIGATAGNLPGKAARSGLFNQSVRQAMGLPTFAEDIERISQDLFGLLARSPASYVSWQGAGGDEVQEPAPWVAALHLEARRRGLSLQGPREMATTPQAAASPVPRPAPVLSTNQVPARVTASQYQSLIDCPYQYFARAVLRLREADEVQEEMEKRDFGEFVHAILHRFHLRVPLVSALASDDARAVLLDETAAVFAAALEQNFMARAWRLQWESAIDAYISWQQAREGEGWRWQAGELGSAFELELDGGQLLRIEGRIDRVDMRRSNDGEESAVIDYKARAQSLLNAKLNKPGEDVQLPVYIALAEANWPERGVGEAAYLGITRGEVKAALYPDAASAGQRHVVRLTHLFEKIHQGAPLPAQGNELACRYCEARGLCRRDHWPVEVADG